MLISKYFLLQLLPMAYGFLDPFSITIGIGSAFKGMVCRFKECCTDSYIPANFDLLEKILIKKLYGQHLVNDIVVHALRSHWSYGANKPPKALTMSFHGWPGSGKNYVTKFIVENLYKEGFKSAFVHQFVGRLHFPSVHKIGEYQDNLYQWIKTNVTNCPKQIFIFDEVDKMPPGILNVIKNMIDYRDTLEGIDYRESIFIFLSNTGAHLINERYMDLWHTQGIKREHLKMSHFEKLILQGAFNEEGGFHDSDTIKSNLIDHYIPFLPMEREHVKMCIIDQFRQRNVNHPEIEHINDAMEFIEWDGPSEQRLFSKTGCKRLSQKIGVIITKNRHTYNYDP